MESGHLILLHLLLSTLISGAFPHSLLKLNSANLQDDIVYCKSWFFVVETNDANPWKHVPLRCVLYLITYWTRGQYLSDSYLVGNESLVFAETVEVSGDGKDAWVFDIDETLLSNFPYYADHGFGNEPFDENAFGAWVNLCKSPALPASLKLYNEVQALGFTIILLTGRDESLRNCTVKNLVSVGYSNWERLILRGPSDQNKSALVYKSEKRIELEAKGYRIHGNSGDQWSDLHGFATATKSFKLPNPIYFVA